MQMARKRHAELLRDVVASYVDGISVPKLDESEIAAHRARLDAYTPSRRLMTTVGLATAAILALFLAVDASAVVAGMQRVFAAFMLVGGRTVPMSVREVDLTTARADVPFAIIVPPSLPGMAMTLREIRSTVSPANDSVAFDLHMSRTMPDVAIVESRDGGGPRYMYLSVREPDRGDAGVAPPRTLPKIIGARGAKVSLIGNLSKGSFAPLTWVTHGTRIVLISQPGALSDAKIRAIRSAMSDESGL